MHKQLEHIAPATVAVLHAHIAKTTREKRRQKLLNCKNKYEHLLGKVDAQVIRASSFCLPLLMLNATAIAFFFAPKKKTGASRLWGYFN